MELNKENYHSKEAALEYMSVSQFKDFAGTMGKPGCEAKAMAKLRGEWVEEKTKPLLVGAYVDSYFEGTLSKFKKENPEVFLKNGSDLKSEFKHAEVIIDRIKKDDFFMKFLSGEKQKIMIAEVFGVKWKIMVDFMLPDIFITDLKIMKCLDETFWVKDYGRMSFVYYWGYDMQACIYQKVIEKNIGKRLPFYIAAASKESEPNIEIIGFTQRDLDDVSSMIEMNVSRVMEVKSGKAHPDRCERCDYCRSTKKLSKPIHFSELTEKS